MDPDNDGPKNKNPRLLIDMNGDRDFDDENDLNLTMEYPPGGTPSFVSGVEFHRNWVFNRTGTFLYSFFVENEANETAYIGPFEGLVVRTDEIEPHEQDLLTEASLWSLVVLVFSICFLVVGMGVGQAQERDRRKRIEQKKKGMHVKDRKGHR